MYRHALCGMFHLLPPSSAPLPLTWSPHTCDLQQSLPPKCMGRPAMCFVHCLPSMPSAWCPGMREPTGPKAYISLSCSCSIGWDKEAQRMGLKTAFLKLAFRSLFQDHVIRLVLST
ncbi:hypothetical protein BKA56DRAFT_599128 [Ilyonectria sp. MPI-CAGE-AT-0026]|nr:hypothetical protein BKA56DRAFT_599128 [Ilyonectria sp. MPI-CAGE-AT-0026]